MAALGSGTNAPPIALDNVDEGVQKQPSFERLTLLAFYKVTCPTCQLAFRYMDGFRDYVPHGLDLIAIAEADEDDAVLFRNTFGGHFETLLDPAPFAASSAYGLTNVPTLFLVEPGGRIARSQVGFSKTVFNEISRDIALRLGVSAREICPANDGNPAEKPG
ncbi:MAG TPA: TlpA disulfide reductase family protein [Armatimonadota bacterium]